MNETTLSPDQQRALKAKAHALNPVVMIAGKGLTENVWMEIENALRVHELIKIKISGYEKDERMELSTLILEKTQASFIQAIGHVLVIYRKNEEKARKAIRPKTHGGKK